MASYNKVFLIGNLTRDPEMRQLPSGGAVCKLRLAVNRRYTSSQGEDREETCFVDVECWGRQAETSERYLSKGRPVMIEGRLQQDRWQDNNTGEPRSRMLVRALQVQFLGRPQQTGDGRQPDAVRETARNPQQPAQTARTSQGKEEMDMPDFEEVDDSYGDVPF